MLSLAFSLKLNHSGSMFLTARLFQTLRKIRTGIPVKQVANLSLYLSTVQKVNIKVPKTGPMTKIFELGASNITCSKLRTSRNAVTARQIGA